MAMTDIELDVELLKKEVSDMKEIHGRLDTAITKITDVSNCINRMLAVHEEKIFKCSICASSFTYKTNLKTHIESVHEGKTFKCEFCS